MQWEGEEIYADATLPFGLRSTPLIFTALADALQWVMGARGVQWVTHYIDNFITMGAPEADECAKNFTLMHAVCEQMGLPVETLKDEGPGTCLSFLGIELDTVAMESSLPAEKLMHLQQELETWRSKKSCR